MRRYRGASAVYDSDLNVRRLSFIERINHREHGDGTIKTDRVIFHLKHLSDFVDSIADCVFMLI